MPRTGGDCDPKGVRPSGLRAVLCRVDPVGHVAPATSASGGPQRGPASARTDASWNGAVLRLFVRQGGGDGNYRSCFPCVPSDRKRIQPLLTEACPTTSPADNCTAHSSLGLTTARKSMPNSWSSWNVRCKTTRMTTLRYAREGQANGPEQEQPCPSHHCAPQSPRLSRKSR